MSPPFLCSTYSYSYLVLPLMRRRVLMLEVEEMIRLLSEQELRWSQTSKALQRQCRWV